MKVRITDIPYEGLAVEADLPLKALNARLSEGEGGNEGFEFLSAPRVSLRVFKTSHGGEVKGKVTGKYTQTCSLCLDGIERALDLDTHFVVRQRPEGASPDSPDFCDDVGIFYFDGEHVDLEDILQEIIMLSFDMYWHPPLDEKKTCTLCRKEFNELKAEEEEQKPSTFSELLKKAGINTKN